ncbi:MAG: SLC13 family permease [Planctomycetota bacterium]
MPWQAWFTLGVTAWVLGLLMFTRISTDVVFVAGVVLLMVFGILTPRESVSGMGNPDMVTVGVLYIVVAGLQETGGIKLFAQRVLGHPKTLFAAQLRLLLPVTGMSAFLNNTPLVAMLIPGVTEWAKNLRLSVSYFMMPLSFATILGGTCSLVGTSTNLVVNGMLTSETKQPGMGMFEIAWVGVPTAIAGLAYLLVLGRRLLPERKPAMSQLDDPREYTIEMMVEPTGPFAGKTIEQAGLRHLPGAFLVEIDRSGEIVAAPGPEVVLRGNDRLVFAGVLESMVDLRRFRGLTPATDQVFKLDAPRAQRCLIEAVVSDSCPIVGLTIREGQFRTRYNSVVIAVARNGERINKKIGDIVLKAGDTLLLESLPAFVNTQRNNRDFFLVSHVPNSAPPRHDRMYLAIAVLLGMVIAAATGWVSTMEAAMVAAGLMIIFRCCTITEARASVDWQVLIAIAASIAVGLALKKSGAADGVAGNLIALAGGVRHWPLVYAVTAVLTELMNNVAARSSFPSPSRRRRIWESTSDLLPSPS